MALAIVAAVVLLVLAIAAATALRRADDIQRLAVGASILVLAAMTVYVVLTAEGPGSTAGPLSTDRPGPAPTGAGPSIAPSAAGSQAPTFLRYEVRVAPGVYNLYEVDPEGQIQSQRSASFGSASHAPVERLSTPGGGVYWRVMLGGLTGWSFVPEQSGDFEIFAVFVEPDGSLSYRPADERSSTLPDFRG